MQMPHDIEGALSSFAQQMEEATQKVLRACDEFTSFGKENVDAFVQSGSVFSKGCEDLSKTLMGSSQSTVEAAIATSKAMLAVKTLRELMDIQTDFFRKTVDTLMADSTRVSELSAKITHKAMQPINDRMTLSVEKFSKHLGKAA